MAALGATLIKAPFDQCWNAMEARAFPGIEGTFVHPFDDHDFIAGNASVGLEILEDLPNVKTVIAAIGGGGLVAGIGSAMRAVAPHVRVLGAEPETAAPGAASFAVGSPQVFEKWQATFVDGAGGKSIFPRMWERLKDTVDGSTVVTLDEVKAAMKLAASKMRVIAEGAGGLSIAAALKESEGPVVAVVSGGNIDLKKFCEIVT
jgi:threonine dehydratase